LVRRGIAGIETLWDACLALGVTVMVCEAGLRALDRSETDLLPGLPVQVGGLVSFLGLAGERLTL